MVFFFPINWLNGVLRHFNSISVISQRQLTLFMSFLGFTSTRLGSEVSCPRTLGRMNPEDPVRLEPRTPGLRVKTLYHWAMRDPKPFPKQALVFTCLQYKSFENTVEKGEIAWNKQFLLFLQCFLPVWRTFCHFDWSWNYRLQLHSVSKSLKFVFWERVKKIDSSPENDDMNLNMQLT